MAGRIIEAMRNRKTDKLFILLDEVPGRYKLINPEGNIVSLPAALFDEDPVVFEQNDAGEGFTDEQLNAYIKHMMQLEAREELDERARVETIERKRKEAAVPKRVPTQRTSSGRRRQKEDHRTGLGASWSGATLSFYRPQIDRLGPKQMFKVSVIGVGDFWISKQDFLNTFADVVLSPAYKADGFFAYRQIPEKAYKFLKKD